MAPVTRQIMVVCNTIPLNYPNCGTSKSNPINLTEKYNYVSALRYQSKIIFSAILVNYVQDSTRPRHPNPDVHLRLLSRSRSIRQSWRKHKPRHSKQSGHRQIKYKRDFLLGRPVPDLRSAG